MGIFGAPRGLLPPGGASVAAPPNTGGEASRPRTAGSLSGGPAGQWGGVGRGSSPGVSPCGIARESVPLPLPPVHEPTRGSEGSFWSRSDATPSDLCFGFTGKATARLPQTSGGVTSPRSGVILVEA
jgi:hypothetical protein